MTNNVHEEHAGSHQVGGHPQGVRRLKEPRTLEELALWDAWSVYGRSMKQAVKWVDVKADIVVKQVATLVTNDTWETDEYPLMSTECECGAQRFSFAPSISTVAAANSFSRLWSNRSGAIYCESTHWNFARRWKMMRVTYFHCTGLPWVFSAVPGRTQNSTFMRQDSGVFSSLFFLLIGMCCGWDPWVRLKQRKQLNARRGAEHALVEAQNKIAQMDQALQQGERPMVSVGQLVDTRVLARPNMWDGRKKAWWKLTREPSTSSCRRTWQVQRSVRMWRATKVWRAASSLRVCSGISSWSYCALAEPWAASPMLRMAGAWRRGGCSFKRILRSWRCGHSTLDTNDVVMSLETMERKIEMGIVSRQAEEGPMRTHLIMNARFCDFLGTSRPRWRLSSMPRMRWWQRRATRWMRMPSRRSLPKMLPKVPEWSRRKSCFGTERRRAIELAIAARNRRTTTKDSRRVRRQATAKARTTRRSSKGSSTRVARWVTCRRIASPRKRVPSKQAWKAWPRLGASTWRASTWMRWRSVRCSCWRRDRKMENMDPQESARKEDRRLLPEKAKGKRRALCWSPGKRTCSSLQS